MQLVVRTIFLAPLEKCSFGECDRKLMSVSQQWQTPRTRRKLAPCLPESPPSYEGGDAYEDDSNADDVPASLIAYCSDIL